MKKVLYTKERFKGRMIRVYVNSSGWFFSNYTGSKHYSYSSDAIVDAKKAIRKKLASRR